MACMYEEEVRGGRGVELAEQSDSGILWIELVLFFLFFLVVN
jgi:hypothetical protein